MSNSNIKLQFFLLGLAVPSGCVVVPAPPPPPPPPTPEQREAAERQVRQRAAAQTASRAAFDEEERSLYSEGGAARRGLLPYIQRLSNYAEYRGPNTVGAERMAEVAKPYRFVQIYVKSGASLAQISRYGSYAAQVRDVFVYPMTRRARTRSGNELAAAVQQLCPSLSGYLLADHTVAGSNKEIDNFLESKLGDDGPKIWRYGSPSVSACRLMDFGA